METASLKDRMIRAAKLDVNLYKEVEADEKAFGQAMLVVVISGLAAGIGNLEGGIGGAFIVAITALIGWFIWAYITYFIGTKFFPESQTHADYGQLLRTIGFSSAPGVLRILGIIPAIGSIISFAASIWMLVAMIIGVREALDYTSTMRAVVVCIIGWIIQLIIVLLAVALFGGLK